MTILTFEVLPEESGKQVKHILRARGVSVTLMNRLKRQPQGLCLNGEAVVRTIDPVHTGDQLILRIPEDAQGIDPIPYPLDILYEDGDLLVINKPPTLPMHPSHNHQGDTLANAVAAYMAEKGKTVTFRAAGRLDKGTSGVVVCCLHAFAAAKLNGQVKKTYLALVNGCYTGAGSFRNTIYRPYPNRTLRACREYDDARLPGDETAVTHWEALGSDGAVTLLRVQIETGRTHQIRVHFAHHGTPLLGDDFYGAPERAEPGHFLHCAQAELLHPVTAQPMTFTAPLPEHMATISSKYITLNK